ncbi:MAG: IreB family regulatory phosphoprotein [Negativicutes bacterium]|jgi:uncharacterized protein (UPF0297 family)
MSNSFEHTMRFKPETDDKLSVREVFGLVSAALIEKGYDPINQIVGYLITGDPAYITSHGDARTMMRKLQRDDVLEELVRDYLK